MTHPNLRRKIGWSLILLSGAPWMLMFAIPWLSIPYPVLAAGVLYGLSQILWFVGLWCVGREVITHVKGTLVRVPFFKHLSRIWVTAVQHRPFEQRQSHIPLQSSAFGLTTQASGELPNREQLGEEPH